jgi:hypothetical protein
MTRKLIIALAASALTLALLPQVAHAEEKVCRGSIGARTLDNVKVPQGATCTLRGTKVKGTIKVNNDARLEAIDVNVVGNVQGEAARNVIVRKTSRVGGSIQVVQGKRASVVNSNINGDILYDDQSGRLSAVDNKVGGSVQAFQNTGGTKIARNAIDGNLQCKENQPAPIGDNNRVGGNKEDQCKRL